MTIQYLRNARNYFIMKRLLADTAEDRTKAIEQVKKIEKVIADARTLLGDYSYAPFDRRITGDHKTP